GVDGPTGLEGRLRPDADDAVVAEPQVGQLVEALRRVDDSAIGDAQDGHGRLPRAEAPEEWFASLAILRRPGPHGSRGRSAGRAGRNRSRSTSAAGLSSLIQP